LDRIEKNYREGNYPEFEKANVGFHSTIWKAADNEDLIEMLGNIYERVKRFRSVTRSYPDKTRDVVNPHKEILEAVMEKDSRKAGKLVRRHLQRYVEDVVAMLERQPD
jgi:DNA-binding GntR family transcriptional regulator